MKTIISFFAINSRLMGITALVLLLGISSCKKDNNTVMNGSVSYSGTFVKSTDAVVTSATGTVAATLNPTTMVLSYTVVWTGLGSNAANMHFHDAGPVIYPITGFATSTSGTVSGTVTFTASQVSDLNSGKIYVQIHSVNIPAGEIKATLSKTSSTYTSVNSSGGLGY